MDDPAPPSIPSVSRQVGGGEARSSRRRRRRSPPRSGPSACASRPCARVHHSGWWNGTRSWNTVARTPPRCAGYIHSLKTNASSRPASSSTGGRPSRLHAVRSACEAGSGDEPRARPGCPSSAARIAPGPRRLVGANATSSCRSCGGRAHAGERAADVVPDPGARMGERRDVDDDPHAGSSWTNESKCAPSLRSSVLPGIDLGGDARRRDREADDAACRSIGSSGTRSVADPSGATAILATGCPRTYAVTRVSRPAKSVGSEWRPTSSAPAHAAQPLPAHARARPGVVRVEAAHARQRRERPAEAPERRPEVVARDHAARRA